MIKIKQKKTTIMPNGFVYQDRPPTLTELEYGKKIIEILGLQKSEIIFNDRSALNPFELDIWIPKLKRAFELQDIRHIKNKDTKLTDDLKKKVCKKRKIFLTRIPYNMQTKEDIEEMVGGWR